ncbi:uncharacterized protein L201_001943 [Kwoniella dendrophila CBS 6074]|uniref:Uncharacterized protein n=1 Tax=Kwoniella dendrophila CBS 6074 TaxID=1295534 RepID=A0AAX4JRD5_9TREE
MEAFYQNIVPLLPINLQEVAYNPPSLSNPTSFIPVIKLIFPYTKWILILSSIFILWSFFSRIFGIFSRLLRFSMKIGPLIGLVAWLMNNSGQGSLDELFGLVKQYFGLANQNQGLSPGIASLASLFNNNNNGNNDKGSKYNTKNKNSAWTGSSAKTDPISSRTRNNKNKNKNSKDNTAGEIFENIINSATKEENVNELGNIVQDFVKNSLLKASGLDWLFGNGNNNNQQKDEDKKSKKWTSR